MRIAINLDDTIFDVRQKLVDEYNKIHGTNINKESLSTNDYSDGLPNWNKKFIEKLMEENDFYKDVYLMDFDTYPVLKKLSKEHLIFIHSAGNNMKAKSNRIEDLTIGNFVKQEIYLTNGFSKDLIFADVFVDDQLFEILNNNSPMKVLFDYYNVYDGLTLPTNIIKIKYWNELEGAINELTRRRNGVFY